MHEISCINNNYYNNYYSTDLENELGKLYLLEIEQSRTPQRQAVHILE